MEINNDEIITYVKEIAKLIFSGDRGRIKIFEIGEENGIHITPVHFYQPIPDTRTLPSNLYNKPLHHPEVDLREEEQIKMLKRFSKYANELVNVPRKPSRDKKQYYFENDMFGALDACIYYSIIREYNPKRIIEIGSGFSTMIASQAARKNVNTRITSIEPYPNEILKNGLPNMTELIQEPVQNISLRKFKELEENDILFIDSSHILTIGSDVNYLYLHVIPELKPGVLIHIHDIFFPYELPKEWVIDRKLFWNEMYLVWAFLIGNSKYEVLLSNYYLAMNHMKELVESFPMLAGTSGGGSLWVRKK